MKLIELVEATSSYKVKISPHPDNKDPDNFKKFLAYIGDEHVATVSEMSNDPITHVARKGYNIKMLSVRDSSGQLLQTRGTSIRSLANASEWIANNYVPKTIS